MMDKGIVVSQVHARHSCVQEFSCVLPNLDRIEKKIISIPSGWWLTVKERQYIVNSIKKFSNIYYPKITKLSIKDIEQYKNLLKKMNGYTEDSFNSEGLGEIWVMKSGDDIISTAKLHIEKKIYDPLAHIQDVVTNKNNRGKRYGKQRITYLSDKALNDLGCYKVVLSCYENLGNFYEKCGFEVSGLSYTKRK